MARNKIGLKFTGFAEMIEKLDKLQGDISKTTEQALIASKEAANVQIKAATNKANFPAKGKYSTGDVYNSIDTDMSVTWQGTVASIKIGYDFKKSGPVSIFLMYGTPRQAKVQAMFDAIYGKAITTEIRKIQKEIFAQAINERMEGN